MLQDGKIWIGTGSNGPVYLLPAMANRHGLIAGATGTGKTVTLKVLAESFSDMGVPVFLSDVKSDLSGMVRPGTRTDALDQRLQRCGIDPDGFAYHDFPSVFWDVYGENGRPIQSTVEGMGPQLLGRMLGLNETQTGVLSILFRYCRDYEYPLRTLEDLKQQLIRMGNNTDVFTVEYGNVSRASVGAIQRAVAMLQDEGGDVFFGQQEFDVNEWLKTDEKTERGVINILAADRLFAHPLMYSTFLMWMLTRLYETLPEVGDPEKPKAVFFFDEAHLLFDDCSKALMDKTEQIVRLIRSKGVGVYFITQSPADVPMSILGQLGNRVQHALRAYTPLDQKAVRVAAQTFRVNEDFDTETAITELKTGEALISCLGEDGAPGIVQRALVLPPQSHLGALTPEERAQAAYNTTSPVSPTTPEPVQEITGVEAMSQTFKVFDPVTGQYVEQEKPDMTQPQPVPTIQVNTDAVEAAAEAAVYAAAPAIQAAAPAVQAAVQAAAPAVQAAVQAAAPVVQAAAPAVQAAVQAAAPVVQAAMPVLQQLPVMVLDQATGQYVQQMMWMQQDPNTGNWIPLPQMQPAAVPAPQAPAAPAAPADPVALAEQQKAAAAAQKEAEKAAIQAQKDAIQAQKDAEKAAKEQEAAERRARNDALREEAAERARRNDSVTGRIRNTAIATATREVTRSVTKGVTNAISDLFDGDNKKKK